MFYLEFIRIIISNIFMLTYKKLIVLFVIGLLHLRKDLEKKKLCFCKACSVVQHMLNGQLLINYLLCSVKHVFKHS